MTNGGIEDDEWRGGMTGREIENDDLGVGYLEDGNTNSLGRHPRP